MKKLILCTILLITKTLNVLGCGPFYPYGEDIRFSILDASKLGFDEYEAFNYSAEIYNNYSEYLNLTNQIGLKSNIQLWQEKYKGSTYNDICEIIYVNNNIDILKSSDNTFLKSIQNKKDTNAIKYIKFAKSCEPLNSFYFNDPWEREQGYTQYRALKIKVALKNATINKDQWFKKRYTFLAIRLMFYNQQLKELKALYDSYFKVNKAKDVVDYWAMYFRAISEENNGYKNYLYAQVFANTSDKRIAVNNIFDRNTPINDVLKYAKTKEEKAAVYLIYSVRKLDKSLEYIKEYHALVPNSLALNFLVFREVNKLEDWILTP